MYHHSMKKTDSSTTLRSDPPPRTAGDHKRALTVGDRRREYLLHVPPGWDGCRELPLVISFHGRGGTAKLSAMATGWSDKSDSEGFFVVYPEGTRPHPDRAPSFLHNPPFWNIGGGIGYGEEHNVDDDAFMAALLADLLDGLPIDHRRIFAAGFSNGASMAMQLALRFQEHVAAVGAIAGHLWLRDPQATITEPISLLFIIGDADPFNPLEGGTVATPWGKPLDRPPIARTVETWAGWLGCESNPNVPADADGVRRVRYGPTARGAEVDFITLAGAGHVWPGGPDVLIEKIAGPSTDKLNATKTMWEFFQQHGK